MRNKKENIGSMITAALFTAIITLLAQVTFMLGVGVPFSLQVFGIALCGYILGAGWGTASVGVYILMGAVGLPVFSGFKGGFQTLLGPTGGFVVGFLVLALCCGIAKKSVGKKRMLLGISGLVGCHILGVIFLCLFSGTDLVRALVMGSAPFIVKDILLVILAEKTAKQITKRILK